MTKRPLWQVIVFGIITLGIYDLVWLYKTRNEMVAKGQKIPSFWLLFWPVLLLLAVVLLILAVPRGADSASARAVGIFGVLAGLVGVIGIIVIAFYWYYKYCKAVEAVTAGQTTFGLAYGLWFLFNVVNLSFIWPAFIQNGFNKVSAGGDTPPSPVASQPAPPAAPQAPTV